jgi:dTDP-4-dehydrorhamnose reductase
MKVAIIGSNGQLGSDLARELSSRGCAVSELTHELVQVESQHSVQRALTATLPDVVMNTAAFHNFAHCEADPSRSFAINSQGALNVARVTRELGAINVFFSTDYVFDGRKNAPYVEDDSANPLSVYGRTKLEGERHSLECNPRTYVIRVSGLYGNVPCRAKGGNFVTTMMRRGKEQRVVSVVDDEVLTPTSTAAIAARVLDVVHSDAYGLFHLTCEGSCSWYDFAEVIFEQLGLPAQLERCRGHDSGDAIGRPRYSVLENARSKTLGLPDMPGWREALGSFLAGVERVR